SGLSAGLMLAGLAAGPALSQAGAAVVTGADVEAILAIARRHGEAEREDQYSDDPGISGVIDGIDYYVYFVNCGGPAGCEDLNFYAGFYDIRPELEAINEWNRDRRFGKAYLDHDGDAVVEMDINLEHGVTADNLDSSFQVWALVLSEFVAHIGYE